MESVVTLNKGQLSASIKTHGAELSSLKLGDAEYLWQADARWWGRHAPVLFPIVGVIRDGRAMSAAGECRMGRHGIARDQEFEVTSSAEDSVTLRLEANDATREAFPYDFALEMSYSLEGASTLAQTFSVTNTGEVELPFCIGGHPAFNVPVPGDAPAFEDYALEFARPWTASTPIIVGALWDYGTQIPLLEDENRLQMSRSLFDHDTVVLEDVPESTVTLAGPEGHGVRLGFEGFDYLGIWSPFSADGEGAPMLAVEPWCGTATRTDEDDVFEHKQGLLVAAPGETVTKTFRITLL